MQTTHGKGVLEVLGKLVDESAAAEVIATPVNGVLEVHGKLVVEARHGVVHCCIHHLGICTDKCHRLAHER